ncbi:MAG: hypothetical protein IKD89_06780 [Clostridia bacterium]|nr:hypothetical protein [Clostridia bacterium]
MPNNVRLDNAAFDGMATEMALRQLGGADIKKMVGQQFQIDFPLEAGYKLRYVYTINTNNALFLQRLLPYAMRPEKFATQKELIKYIKDDVNQFKNAQKSKNFASFVTALNKLHELAYSAEDTFLNFNVDAAKVQHLTSTIETLLSDMEATQSASDKIVLDEKE